MKYILMIVMVLSVFSEARSTLKELVSDDIEKPIVLMVSMNNCRYCKKQKKVIREDDVTQYIVDNFQFTEINMSLVSLPEKLQTKSAPTLFILDKDGEVISKNMGYKKKDDLMNLLKKSLKELKVYDELDYQLEFR